MQQVNDKMIFSGSNSQFNTQSFKQPVYSIPAGLHLAVKGLVEAFTVKAGLLCQFGNAPVFHYITKGNDEHSWIIIKVRFGEEISKFLWRTSRPFLLRLFLCITPALACLWWVGWGSLTAGRFPENPVVPTPPDPPPL